MEITDGPGGEAPGGMCHGPVVRKMKVDDWRGYRRITISPGEFYVSDGNVLIATILGSCVSACLYDPLNGVVGMNHFLLSSDRYGKETPLYTTEAGRYGVNSMELLINKMLKQGAKRGNLKAKAFGGASVLKPVNSSKLLAIGEVNTKFIREFLRNEGIPLTAYDLGGTAGREIYFYSGDFSVHVKRMSIRGDELTERECRFWKKSLRHQREAETQIELWQE